MKSSQIIRPQATPTFSQKLPIAEMEFCTPETLNIWSFRVWEHLKKEWQTMYEKNSYLLQRHFKPFNSVVLGLVPQKLDKNPRSFNPALTKDSICTRKVVKWFKVLQQQEGSQTCSGMWLNETLNITRTPSDTAKWSTGRPANLQADGIPGRWWWAWPTLQSIATPVRVNNQRTATPSSKEQIRSRDAGVAHNSLMGDEEPSTSQQYTKWLFPWMLPFQRRNNRGRKIADLHSAQQTAA
jgi:hypothetical protein